MRLGNYTVQIPEGREHASGYVEMKHGMKYTIRLSNSAKVRCDAEVEIDGKLVGIWRLPEEKMISLERPVHDTGRFTFYRYDTPEARMAGLVKGDKLGLISVLFKPEKSYLDLDSIPRFSAAGGTGLSGESSQEFIQVPPLDYDEAGFVRIHLRLASGMDEPRPLTPASTPVPPALP
jgi:hypothetical protein